MIDFPNAKINLGLYVTAKREDGFHNIATLFYPVPLTDSLEILPDRGQEVENEWTGSLPTTIREKLLLNSEPPVYIDNAAIRYSRSGLDIEGPPSQNLCIKAYEMLKNDFPGLPGIQLHLHKNIPTGAGLGGGSSDGAFSLVMLNQIFDLRLSTAQLTDYASRLGSDCPFFVLNQPAIGGGRGEILEPTELDLSGYHLVLIHPGIHVSTAKAFAGVQPRPLENGDSLASIVRTSPQLWPGQLENVFEGPVFKQFPVIGALKQHLYDAGALYASMSGSGSTVFGLFEAAVKKKDFNLPAESLFYQVQL